MRLDAELVRRGMASGRERAKECIAAGRITVNGVIITKVSRETCENDEIALSPGSEPDYVGRGGYKLAGALDVFAINVSGLSAIDVGASTGGFTDCLLRRGAARVTAVDVGSGQLAEVLRKDDRVICMENTDIRKFTPDEAYDFACVDVSFISLKLVLPHILSLINSAAHIVALIKPQFEAGLYNVGKNGIVKDKGIHAQVLSSIHLFVREYGCGVKGMALSPIAGGDGNKEFLADIVKDTDSVFDVEAFISGL